MHLTNEEINARTGQIVDTALKVHTFLGPGLLEKQLPIHEAQLLSYLRLTGFRVGLLINFHEEHLKDGIKRRVHRF
jgi:hypothetical protein